MPNSSTHTPRYQPMHISRILFTLGIGSALGACLALPIAAMHAPIPTVPVCRQGVVL